MVEHQIPFGGRGDGIGFEQFAEMKRRGQLHLVIAHARSAVPRAGEGGRGHGALGTAAMQIHIDPIFVAHHVDIQPFDPPFGIVRGETFMRSADGRRVVVDPTQDSLACRHSEKEHRQAKEGEKATPGAHWRLPS